MTGGGVAFAEFGPDCVTALDLINRGMYEHRFTDYWLKPLPEVIGKLQAAGACLMSAAVAAACASL